MSVYIAINGRKRIYYVLFALRHGGNQKACRSLGSYGVCNGRDSVFATVHAVRARRAVDMLVDKSRANNGILIDRNFFRFICVEIFAYLFDNPVFESYIAFYDFPVDVSFNVL